MGLESQANQPPYDIVGGALVIRNEKDQWKLHAIHRLYGISPVRVMHKKIHFPELRHVLAFDPNKLAAAIIGSSPSTENLEAIEADYPHIRPVQGQNKIVGRSRLIMHKDNGGSLLVRCFETLGIDTSRVRTIPDLTETWNLAKKSSGDISPFNSQYIQDLVDRAGKFISPH